jgi:hypothetical protein
MPGLAVKAKLIDRRYDLVSPTLLSHRRVQGTSAVPLRNVDDLKARIRPQCAVEPQRPESRPLAHQLGTFTTSRHECL